MAVDLLQVGRSGLSVAKKQLSTTSHNIANSNTEGYSRQRVHTEASRPIGEGNYVLGTGADVKNVKRVHDEHVEKRIHQAVTQHNFNEERSFQLSQVEDIFNEVHSDGLNKLMNRFFNSFRELANQPENETVRSIVRENARLVVNDFKRMRSTLQDLRENINSKMKATVEDINTMLHHVRGLNQKIAELEAIAHETGDLRDQRDKVVLELSELMDIQTYADERNRFVINATNVGSLVVGGEISELKHGTINTNTEDIGHYEIFFKNRSVGPVSPKLKSGKLGAILETRNNEIKRLEDHLDRVAFELTHSVNAIHRRGYINVPLEVDENGRVLDRGIAAERKITGIDFFKEPLDLHRAAEYLDLSEDVKKDVNNIVTGLEPNKPGDNRISIAISKLQHEKVLHDGTTTFEEGYLNSVGEIALVTSKTKIDKEQSLGILSQAKTVKERISGVSIDEETANLVKFQHAYDASAKVIKTADEMFKTVLDIKR
ncbi:MAG: flagellar hook-associated protein FlgK [Bacteriovoracaceae bacterium]|nr:flagellar hook-associated protein FlgK [Bacteriovoracaceae bacterium]